MSILFQADWHRDNGLSELSQAKAMCIYIPDLEDREHMKVLIASAVASGGVKTPIAKIVTVGLSLIGSMASNVYENYLEMRSHLTKGAYHLEMSKFYNEISINAADQMKSIKDSGTDCFLDAIDSLTLCQMLAAGIEDEDIQRAITDAFNSQRKLLMSQMKNAPSKLSKKLSGDGWMFYENIEEIMAECGDESLKEDFEKYTYSMVNNLENAERHWGIK